MKRQGLAKQEGRLPLWLVGLALLGCDATGNEASGETSGSSDDDAVSSAASDAGPQREPGAQDDDAQDDDARPSADDAPPSDDVSSPDDAEDDAPSTTPDDDIEGDGPGSGGESPSSSNDIVCTVGDLDCVCYPNQTCNDAFRCDLGICRAPSTGAGGAANCVGESGCACYPNQTCNAALLCVAGTCEAGPSGTGGAGPGSAGSAGSGGMNQGGSGGEAPDDGRAATVVVLLDRSMSMFATSLPAGSSPPVGDYPDAWEAARAAIASLEPFADQVAFGAMTFTELGEDACPLLQGTELTPTLNAFQAVKDLTPPSADAIPDAIAGTPLREGLQAGYAVLDAVSSSAPKVLLFIGDGSAAMCSVLDQGAYCGSDPAVGVVQEAYARGIVTLAVGIGGSGNPVEAVTAPYLLNAVAHAGRGLPVAPSPELDQWRTCLQLEYPAITGEPVGDDFWSDENWRQYAQGTYSDGPFTEDLHVVPDPADLEAAMQELMNEVVLGL